MKTIYVMFIHLTISAIAVLIMIGGLFAIVNTGLDIFIKFQTLHTKTELSNITQFEVIKDF